MKYRPLSVIADGDFVVINWPYEENVGIKGTVNDSPAVMIIVTHLVSLPGPFTFVVEDV